MVVRKGPCGQFLAQKLSSEDTLYDYALEVIERERPMNLLPVYVYPDKDYGELGYDITGMSPVTDLPGTFVSKNRTLLRGLFSDLLSFLSEMDDHLLPPGNILCDDRYIFLSNDMSCFRVLFIPTDPGEHRNDKTEEKVENILKGEFFTVLLTTDEITDIVYAARENDKALLDKTAAALKDAQKTDKPSVNKYLYIASLLSFGAAVSYLSGLLFLIPVFVTASAFFLYMLFSKRDTSDMTTSKDDRSRIFFEERKKERSCLILRSVNDIEGEYENRAVYLTEAIVGSDMFLSDICFEMPSICPIHAKIFLKDNSYYVKDISMTGQTYTDNRLLQKDEEREIKDGQILRLGDCDFKISVEMS